MDLMYLANVRSLGSLRVRLEKKLSDTKGRFFSSIEGEITLDISGILSLLGPEGSVGDIYVELHRGPDGNVQSGRVLEWRPVQTGNAFELWKAYHQEVGSEWDNIEDIEKELGRGDD